MQTFLPYVDFSQSASVLDNKRLGKQRVECLQILNVLTGKTKSWQNHPAVKMWRGYERCLQLYGITVCKEWISRGFKDTCLEKIRTAVDYYPMAPVPYWLGDETFHLSHRSNLLRKDFEHYSKYFKEAPLDLPYVWPI